MTDPELVDLTEGEAIVFSSASPVKSTGNEDAASIISVNEDTTLLIVTDGLGGGPNGAAASAILINLLQESLSKINSNESIREIILNSMEKASLSMLENNAVGGTTVAIAEINSNFVRSYHAGDSELLISDREGNIIFQTLSHSPIAYAVESGLIDEDLALTHEDRHYISNYIGEPNMHISMGPSMLIKKGDTLLLGTDGLFDNLYKHEILELLASGDIRKTAQLLQISASFRMKKKQAGMPSKPDDLTFIMYCPN